MSTASEGSSSGVKVFQIVGGIIAFVLILLLGVCAGVIFLGGRMFTTFQNVAADMEEAELAAQDFLDEIAADRLEAAYAETTANFQKRTSMKEFQALVDKNPLLKNYTSRNLDSSTVVQSPATVTATIAGPRGSLTCTFRLVKENQAWKIDRFTIP